ncbi:MAG: LPS export ABC transporter periplasmic protein LptC [Desulfobacteraceae bacterium]|nr:LPS export ABC transporter periplasmic protein LptC [Desulfobacteraceae bacterium]
MSFHNNSKLIKRILLGTGIIGIGIIISVYILYRRVSTNTDLLLTTVENQASMSLKNVKHSAIKEGFKQWDLDAESAQLVELGKKMILEKPSVIFYLENGENIRMKADEGILSIETNDIGVTGNVVISRGEVTLETQALQYLSKKRVLSITTPVEISGSMFDLRADAMEYDLDTEITSFNGNVKGNLRENVSL